MTFSVVTPHNKNPARGTKPLDMLVPQPTLPPGTENSTARNLHSSSHELEKQDLTPPTDATRKARDAKIDNLCGAVACRY